MAALVRHCMQCLKHYNYQGNWTFGHTCISQLLNVPTYTFERTHYILFAFMKGQLWREPTAYTMCPKVCQFSLLCS